MDVRRWARPAAAVVVAAVGVWAPALLTQFYCTNKPASTCGDAIHLFSPIAIVLAGLVGSILVRGLQGLAPLLLGALIGTVAFATAVPYPLAGTVIDLFPPAAVPLLIGYGIGLGIAQARQSGYVSAAREGTVHRPGKEGPKEGAVNSAGGATPPGRMDVRRWARPAAAAVVGAAGVWAPTLLTQLYCTGQPITTCGYSIFLFWPVGVVIAGLVGSALVGGLEGLVSLFLGALIGILAFAATTATSDVTNTVSFFFPLAAVLLLIGYGLGRGFARLAQGSNPSSPKPSNRRRLRRKRPYRA